MSAHRARWAIPTLIMLAAVILALAASSAGPVNAGSNGCKKVSGRIVLEQVTGPECSSPVGLCAKGVVKGGVRGTVFVVVTSALPSGDTPTTGVMFTTGDAVFKTDSGTLLTKDASTLSTSGAMEFAELNTVVGGTGSYEGAWGTLVATGDNSPDGTSGVYSGQICTP